MNAIARQLLKEFYLPLLLAVVWTLFNFFTETDDRRTLKLVVNVFGPAFFLASWAIGQWHRVRKQQSVDSGLTDIQSRLSTLMTQMEATATETAAYITGGDSVCYLTGNMGIQHHPDQISPLWAVHHGKYPLYGIHMRVVDIDRANELSGTAAWLERRHEYETYYQLETLIPNHATDIPLRLTYVPYGTARNFNIFFTARNGSFVQLLRFRKVKGMWLRATKVEMGKVMYEEIPEGYPRDEHGQVDWNSSV